MVLQNTCCLIWIDAIECSPSPQTCCVELYEIQGRYAWEPDANEIYDAAVQEMCGLGSWNWSFSNPPYFYAWVYTKKSCSECESFETTQPRDTSGLGTGFGGGPYGWNPRGLISRYCVPVVDPQPPTGEDDPSACLQGCPCISLEEYQNTVNPDTCA